MNGAEAPIERDVDLAGRFRLRLVDAPPRGLASVARQFGSPPVPAESDPDLTIRYVDRLGGPDLRLIGLGEAAWDDDGFYLLAGRGARAPRARIPFDSLRPGAELLIERSAHVVPLLVPIVNVLMLARGTLALHASAVDLDGRGVAAAGWSKGGKTEAMLALLECGASLLADEWTYMDVDRHTMFGSPGPVRLQDWHLEQLPDIRRRITVAARGRMRASRAVQSAHGRIEPLIRALPGARYVTRAVKLLDDERHVDVPAHFLRDGTPSPGEATLDRLLWVVSSTVDRILVRPCEAGEVAQRMVFSHQHHRLSLVAAYHQYRFAFPDSPSELMETLEERERASLAKSLDATPAFEVSHPPRVSLAALSEALQEALR